MKLENNPTWLPVVACALANDAGQWLMHCRPPGSHHEGLWEFPGGKVEQQEIPALALVREVREELGITLDPADLKPAGFAQGAQAADGLEIVLLLYTCRHWSGKPVAREGGTIDWFVPDDIVQLPMPPLDVMLTAQLFGREAG